ncbi:MAG: molybdenum cofactor biosynthesis protein MoaE [Synechococcaceae cyanobacterium]|nr:molybdenum cofactor biosynthesis protein MoaE [Synechococcaceae cyanobacterium]
MAPARLSLSLQPEDFDPLEEMGRWWRDLAASLPAPPAAESSFVGRVRATAAEGRVLEALELEHYPGMTETQLERLARESAERHGVLAVLVRHRVGRVAPGAAIVLVAVAADRRGPAQRCCQELLEGLKHEAPFWKREWSGGAGRWLAGNTAL